MADIYVVVHLATTFNGAAAHMSRDVSELIALSWCTVDATSLECSPSQSVIIKPIDTPVTLECTSRFGLSWEDVKDGMCFKDGICDFERKLAKQVAEKDFLFVTADSESLRVLLSREARVKSVVLPGYLQHPRVFDLYNEYSKWQALNPEAVSYPGTSLINAITALDVDMKPYPDDSSYDRYDVAVKIHAQVLVQLVTKSSGLEYRTSVLTKPHDSSLDAQAFLVERSKILFLSNLPSDTTHSELEGWFTQAGRRPVAFWALKSCEGDSKAGSQISQSRSKCGYAFAIFSKHEEAADALCMNGRALMGRVIEVQASSSRVLDSASSLLTPFPSSKNRPRPGDWTCPSCGFSNFQRRIACFRCSFPAASALAIQEQNHSVSASADDGLVNGNGVNAVRKHKPDDRQISNSVGGFHDQYHGSLAGYKNGNGNGYILNQVQGQGQGQQNQNQNPNQNQNQNQHQHQNQNQNQNQNHIQNINTNNKVHYGNQVPFRAGDWKCPNESCQYHNFAKNVSCLKCGASKPSTVMHNNLSNNGTNGNHPSAMNASASSIHSVNTTAAVIAAATASGQPLNLTNNFLSLQQPSPHHSRQSGSSPSSASSSPIHNTGLYANISHLQQLQYQQGKHSSTSQHMQHSASAPVSGSGSGPKFEYMSPQSSQRRTKQNNVSGISPSGCTQHNQPYKTSRDFGDGNGNGINSLSSQMSNMSFKN